MKDIVRDGLKQTTYSKDDMEKKIIIKDSKKQLTAKTQLDLNTSF